MSVKAWVSPWLLHLLSLILLQAVFPILKRNWGGVPHTAAPVYTIPSVRLLILHSRLEDTIMLLQMVTP